MPDQSARINKTTNQIVLTQKILNINTLPFGQREREPMNWKEQLETIQLPEVRNWVIGFIETEIIDKLIDEIVQHGRQEMWLSGMGADTLSQQLKAKWL
jgi:hypothetical protein